MTVDPRQARAFDAIASTYACARPGYPDEALDWLLPAGARHVLDLGAGTGKLTGALLDRGLEVTAVEPSDQMRAELERELGGRAGLRSLAGSAESIPIDDGSVDAVLVASAWHWVDRARAVPEVARVLVGGGRLGLLWNPRDDSVPWVAELSTLLVGRAPRRHADNSRIGPPFGEPERFATPRWTQPTTPEGVVDMMATRSYVIVADPEARAEILNRVRALLTGHPDLAGRDRIDFPYVTECVRADLPE